MAEGTGFPELKAIWEEARTATEDIRDVAGIKKITDPVDVSDRAGRALGQVTGTVDISDRAARVVGYDARAIGVFAHGTKTVSASAAELYAGASRLANRYAMIIENTGSLPVYLGASGVTTANGFKLDPGDAITFTFRPSQAVAIYAISTASNEVRILEVAWA